MDHPLGGPWWILEDFFGVPVGLYKAPKAISLGVHGYTLEAPYKAAQQAMVVHTFRVYLDDQLT